MPQNQGQHPRGTSHDYENNPKNIYMSKNTQGRGVEQKGISSGGNNIIMEMEAEQNDDESYYMSNSPVRRVSQQ